MSKTQETKDEELREEMQLFIPPSAWQTHMRITELEERVAKLEAIVESLSEKIYE
jgi:hypothetical protein